MQSCAFSPVPNACPGVSYAFPCLSTGLSVATWHDDAYKTNDHDEDDDDGWHRGGLLLLPMPCRCRHQTESGLRSQDISMVELSGDHLAGPRKLSKGLPCCLQNGHTHAKWRFGFRQHCYASVPHAHIHLLNALPCWANCTRCLADVCALLTSGGHAEPQLCCKPWHGC